MRTYRQDQSNGPDYFKFATAKCGRSSFIKAVLLASLLLVLFNLYNCKNELNTTPYSMSPANEIFARQWPKITQSNSQSTDNAPHIDAHSGNATISTTNTSSKLNDEDNRVILQSDISSVKLNSSYSDQTHEMFDITSRPSTDSVENFTVPQTVSTLDPNNCPPMPPNLVGAINVNTTIEDLRVVESRFIQKLQPGGWYSPKECKAKDSVAIIVPFRNRSEHLPVFFAHMHPFLMKQQIEYGIFLVEQVKGGQFNKAAIMNVGFVEAQKLADWDCFIFNDADLLRMDDRNLYNCPDQPRHMSVAVDTMKFKLPYTKLFGGVSALTKEQFQKVNAFSNEFWGWGAEDDDMSKRLEHAGYHIARRSVNIARYTMVKHKQEEANPKNIPKLLHEAKRFGVDGLNSMKYKIRYYEINPLHMDARRNRTGCGSLGDQLNYLLAAVTHSESSSHSDYL